MRCQALPVNPLCAGSRHVCAQCNGVYPQRWLVRFPDCACDSAMCMGCATAAAEHGQCPTCGLAVKMGQQVVRQRCVTQSTLLPCRHCGSEVPLDSSLQHYITCDGVLCMVGKTARAKWILQTTMLSVCDRSCAKGWRLIMDSLIPLNCLHVLYACLLPELVEMAIGRTAACIHRALRIDAYAMTVAEAKLVVMLLKTLSHPEILTAALQSTCPFPSDWAIAYRLFVAIRENQDD